MNIHPLFVHFPIGILALYSLFEIVLTFAPAWRKKDWTFMTRAFLLFTGVLFALIALVTGGMAEDLIEGVNPRAYILAVHEPFALATALVYFILAAAYMVRLAAMHGWGEWAAKRGGFIAAAWRFKVRVWSFVLDTPLLPFLALLGLVLLTITGGLGAAIVYGPNIDPAVAFVYHLFFIN